MRIRLTYSGYLKLDGAKSGGYIDVEEGSTIGDVLAGFAVPREQQRHLKLFANDESADPSRVVREGDELTVIMQIGGG